MIGTSKFTRQMTGTVKFMFCALAVITLVVPACAPDDDDDDDDGDSKSVQELQPDVDVDRTTFDDHAMNGFLTLDLVANHSVVYAVHLDDLGPLRRRIILRTKGGSVRLTKWYANAVHDGLVKGPFEGTIRVTGTPRNFGSLSPAELTKLKKDGAVESANGFLYWCAIFAYGCKKGLATPHP